MEKRFGFNIPNLPGDLYQTLRAYCKQHEVSQWHVVKTALERYFASMAPAAQAGIQAPNMISSNVSVSREPSYRPEECNCGADYLAESKGGHRGRCPSVN